MQMLVALALMTSFSLDQGVARALRRDDSQELLSTSRMGEGQQRLSPRLRVILTSSAISLTMQPVPGHCISRQASG